jgi:hypothetical protein
VFLTVILPPADEEAFFRVVGLSKGRTHIFRSLTIRRNITYRVKTITAPPGKQEEEENRKVCQVVRQWLNRYISGRVIVYVGLIARVERLGAALGYGHYYAKIGTAKGKTQRLRA